MRSNLVPFGLGPVAALALPIVATPALAGGTTVINLSYDSIMDMVRPEAHPGIAVHHNLQITLFGRNNVAESRDRSTRKASDSNAMRQALGGGNDAGIYAA